jgi:hypothetical protein
MKTIAIATLGACASLLLAGQAGAKIFEDFNNPEKFSNFGTHATLGNPGAAGGAVPFYTFDTWMFSAGNGGIDQPGTGRGDGSGPDNKISSIGLARAQDFRGTNARAIWVVFSRSHFTNGVEYQVSFDVTGDPAGYNAGRYWLAELSGYDNSGNNWIQGRGEFNGWANEANKPFTAHGRAVVNYIFGNVPNNGVPLPEVSSSATSRVSFNFTYNGTNSPDIGFSVGTFNNLFAIDNFRITAVSKP